MTVCNMSIEAGARAGMIAPDDTTFAWLKGRPFAPQGADWDRAVAEWRNLATDPGAKFDRELTIPRRRARSHRHLGHQSRHGRIDHRARARSRLATTDADRRALERALEYMDLKPGTPIEEMAIDRVFIGSCTNSRIEDLRAAAKVVAGHHVHHERPRDGGARIAAGEDAGRSAKVWTASSATPDSIGASPAAPCAWA